MAVAPAENVLSLACLRKFSESKRHEIVRVITEVMEEYGKPTRPFLKECKKKYGLQKNHVMLIWSKIQNGDSVDISDSDEPDEPVHRCESQFPLEILDDQYHVERYLGKGAFGLVALGRATENHPFLQKGDKVAIKKMDRIFDSAVGAKRLIRELRVLRNINTHSCVVRLIDVKIPKEDLKTFNSILLIFECVDCDLATALKSNNFWTEDQVKSVFKQMLFGLKYMHSAQLVHRDLKPQNILVNNGDNGELDVKLCDFGLARCFERNIYRQPVVETSAISPSDLPPKQFNRLGFTAAVTTHVVTRYYRSPEVSLLIQERELLPAIDMWSMGCILGEILQMMEVNRPNPRKREILLKGASDFHLSPNTFYKNPRKVPKSQLKVIFDLLGKPDEDFIEKIDHPESKDYCRKLPNTRAKDLTEIFPGGPAGALDLLRCLLAYDPRQRYTVEDALNHPWLEDVPGLDEDELDQCHEPVIFDFEDIPLSRFTIRLLVIDEIAHYIPELKSNESVTEMRNYTSMKVVDN